MWNNKKFLYIFASCWIFFMNYTVFGLRLREIIPRDMSVETRKGKN